MAEIIRVPGGRYQDGARAGFSLLEMLVVLVIAGVLLFVALPAYRYTVIKSTRAAARGILLDVQSRQEQYFVNNKLYAVNLAGLGLPDPYYVDGQADAVGRESAAYRIALEVQDVAYEGVSATPINAQAGDSACGTLLVTRAGARAASGSQSPNPPDCW